MNFFKKNGAGLLLCLLIAIPSWLLGKAVPVVGGPVFSILIGMIVTLILTDKTVFSPGINFTSKKSRCIPWIRNESHRNSGKREAVSPDHSFHHHYITGNCFYYV